MYWRQNSSKSSGSSLKTTRGSARRSSYIRQACTRDTVASRNAFGFVARRRNPCWVMRQNEQSSSATFSNHCIAIEWCSCCWNAKASQMLTSGRKIIFLHKFGDACSGEPKCAGMFGRHEGQNDSASFLGSVNFRRASRHDCHRSPFGQAPLARQDHHAVLNVTVNLHSEIIASSFGAVMPSAPGLA